MTGTNVPDISPSEIAGTKQYIIKILFVYKYNNWTKVYQCKYFLNEACCVPKMSLNLPIHPEHISFFLPILV